MDRMSSRFNIAPPRRSEPLRRRRLARVFAAVAALSLSGCFGYTVDQRGNLPDPEKIAALQPGTTTKDQVIKILGSPSSGSTFDDKTWYYISRKTQQVAFLQPKVLDQQVLIVAFDDNNVVKVVDHKTLADGESISPASGATPSPGRELSFMEQLLGNVGRFAGSDISR
jgi:outer membrane protein assembly factor BamE (lipoprotein component of BamABCDE complex)